MIRLRYSVVGFRESDVDDSQFKDMGVTSNEGLMPHLQALAFKSLCPRFLSRKELLCRPPKCFDTSDAAERVGFRSIRNTLPGFQYRT